MKRLLFILLASVAGLSAQICQEAPPPYSGFNVSCSADTSTGTTVYQYVKYNAGLTGVVNGGTSDALSQFLGIASATATSGTVLITRGGPSVGAFDGATTAGHYFGLSTGTAGKLTDIGASATTLTLGVVLQTIGGAGNANIDIYELSSKAGTGSGTVTSVATTSPIGGGTITSTGTLTCATCVVASSPGVGLAHFAGSTQTVTSSLVSLTADVSGALPAANIGVVASVFNSGTITIPSGNSILVGCTSTCSVPVPVPAAGYQICVKNDAGVSTAITLSALGSSAMYPKADDSGYGTAGTGTMVSTAAAGSKVCLFGRDSTHYELGAVSNSANWTVN